MALVIGATLYIIYIITVELGFCHKWILKGYLEKQHSLGPNFNRFLLYDKNEQKNNERMTYEKATENNATI